MRFFAFQRSKHLFIIALFDCQHDVVDVFELIMQFTNALYKYMGGKNHQPCRPYLVDSTKLSRFLSLANAELDYANVKLEDIILGELNDQKGDMSQLIDHLSRSLDNLANALAAVSSLRQQMKLMQMGLHDRQAATASRVFPWGRDHLFQRLIRGF